MAAKIWTRLVSQLRAKGHDVNSAQAIATSSLQKSGNLKPGSRDATVKGARRGNMTPGQRAKNRAARAQGKSPKAFKYNARANRATLKG